MSVCDLCNAPVGIGARHYSALQIQRAARSGLRPSGITSLQGALFGLSQDEMHSSWLQMVMRDTTSWTLCFSCAAKVDSFLSEFQRPVATFSPQPTRPVVVPPPETSSLTIISQEAAESPLPSLTSILKQKMWFLAAVAFVMGLVLGLVPCLGGILPGALAALAWLRWAKPSSSDWFTKSALAGVISALGATLSVSFILTGDGSRVADDATFFLIELIANLGLQTVSALTVAAIMRASTKSEKKARSSRQL